jgi:hypothetical protein
MWWCSRSRSWAEGGGEKSGVGERERERRLLGGLVWRVSSLRTGELWRDRFLELEVMVIVSRMVVGGCVGEGRLQLRSLGAICESRVDGEGVLFYEEAARTCDR